MIFGKKEISVTVFNIANVLFILLSFILITAFFAFYEAGKEFDKQMANVQKSFVDNQKENIKIEVERVKGNIENLRKANIHSLEQSLENIVDSATNVAKYIDKKSFFNYLENTSWDNKAGYFLVVDESGEILLDSKESTFKGKNLKNIISSDSEVEDLFQHLKTREEFVGEYKWKLDGSTFNKIIYGRFEPSINSFILAVNNLDINEQHLKEHILDILAKERFGYDDDGYFIVVDDNYEILLQPVRDDFKGTSVFDLTDGKGEVVGEKIVSVLGDDDAGFTSATWERPYETIKESKTLYFAKVPHWNWIMGTGFYDSSFNTFIAEHKKEIRTNYINLILKMMLLFLSVVAVTLLFSFYINRRIKATELSKLREMTMLEQYKLALDASSIVSITDPKGIIKYVNDKFCKTTLHQKEDVVGKSHNIERHPTTPRETFSNMWFTIEKGNVWQGIIKNKKADGTSYYKSATVVPIKNEHGDIIEYISTGHDVTELVENRDKLENIFNTDILTSLGSRMKLLNDIEQTDEPALALLDINGFSSINDHYGDKAGDSVLLQVGSGIFRSLSKYPYSFYRINADTFAVLGNRADSAVFSSHILEAQRSISAKGVKIFDDEVPVNLRSGLAFGSKDVLAYADIALNNAKFKHVESYIYDKEDRNISESYGKNIQIVKSVYSATKNNRVFPVFQPIYNIKARKIEKYESLMRIEDENGEILMPIDFIEISKRTRIYPSLTYIIIEKTIKKFKHEPFDFSINITIEDLMNDDTMNFLATHARIHNVLDRLVIEIVETEELHNYENAQSILKKFKDMGVKIAIDDFGTGYSNFEYLIKLNADFVKIDAAIMKHVLDDGRAMEAVRSIVAFAREMKMKTVAEFISSQELLKAAEDLGIDYAQGFFIGKPSKELIRN